MRDDADTSMGDVVATDRASREVVSSETDAPVVIRKTATMAAPSSTDALPSTSSGLLATTTPFGPSVAAQIAPAVVLNSTAPIEEFLAATISMRQAFDEARRVTRTDESLFEAFAVRLEELLRRYGHVAFEVTGRIVLFEGVDPKLGLTALRAAGHVSEPAARDTRRSLALNALHSKVAEHRYGALHVLADLGDVSAIQDLAAAAQREGIAALRADIDRLIRLLNDR
jgi:hypothetical protein